MAWNFVASKNLLSPPMAPEIWHSVADAKALREALSVCGAAFALAETLTIGLEWTPIDDPEAGKSFYDNVSCC